MKNIVIPLLLANSARTEAKKGEKKMDQDYAVPAPILIADVWTSGECSNDAVKLAATALTAAEGKLTTEKANKAKTQDAAVTKAITDKQTAIDAVIAKDTALAAAIAADDTEQQKELQLKEALDKATYALSAATADAAAKLTAKGVADAAVTAATATQTAMNTAATAAATHYTKEQAQTAQLKLDKTAAESAYATENGKIAALTLIVTGATTSYNAKKLEWDTAEAEKNWAAAIKVKAAAEKVIADKAANTAEVGSVANLWKVKNDLAVAVDTATTKNLWTTAAKATVQKMKDFKDNNVYTDLGAAPCATATAVANAANTDAACKAVCTGLLSWTLVNNLPSVKPIPSGNTFCFGYEFKSDTTACKVMHTAIPTKGTDTANYKCYSRKQSAEAIALFDLLAVSINTATKWTNYVAALGTWRTALETADALLSAKAIADAYKTKWDTYNTNTAIANDTAKTAAYNTKNGELTALKTALDTGVTNETTQKTLTATKLATQTSVTAQLTAQEAEEAAQLVVKGLADADKTKQDALVGTLTTAAGTAATAKTTADGVVTTKTTAKTTAQAAYDAQVTKAAGTASGLTAGLADLKTKRAAAATATTALATALTDQASAQKLVDAAKTALAAATATHLAAVVACKEAEYDKYRATLATAVAARTAALTKIEKLIADAKAAAPAPGAKGARCEKAMSNGTFRPKRGETTCATGLCCGAAKVPLGNAVMTIETCQDKTAKTYAYHPPRAPMATEPPAKKLDAPFTCIEGAKKLATAVSALAAAVYMMA